LVCCRERNNGDILRPRQACPKTCAVFLELAVFGSRENIPNTPDGVFMPPPKPRCSLVKKARDQLQITCIPSRLAILTKALNGRDPCHYCAQYGRGCRTASNFSSSQVVIPPWRPPAVSP
jgi:hypothetical protein